MKISTAHYPKFFAAMRKATVALGYDTKAAQDDYYKRVLREEAHCSSVRLIASQAAFDACLRRFAADAGDFQSAISIDDEKLKRMAYICKVMTIQIMQLNDLDPLRARAYFDGVIDRSRLLGGVRSDGADFWLDVSRSGLFTLLQILDTHLRRLKRRLFPTFPLSFDDRIKFEREGGILMRNPCDKHFYSRLPFSVKLTSP